MRKHIIRAFKALFARRASNAPATVRPAMQTEPQAGQRHGGDTPGRAAGTLTAPATPAPSPAAGLVQPATLTTTQRSRRKPRPRQAQDEAHKALQAVVDAAEAITGMQSARALWAELRINGAFTGWFSRRVRQGGFVIGKDFATLPRLPRATRGVRPLDYLVTQDMANIIRAVEAAAKGGSVGVSNFRRVKRTRSAG